MVFECFVYFCLRILWYKLNGISLFECMHLYLWNIKFHSNLKLISFLFEMEPNGLVNFIHYHPEEKDELVTLKKALVGTMSAKFKVGYWQIYFARLKPVVLTVRRRYCFHFTSVFFKSGVTFILYENAKFNVNIVLFKNLFNRDYFLTHHLFSFLNCRY